MNYAARRLPSIRSTYGGNFPEPLAQAGLIAANRTRRHAGLQPVPTLTILDDADLINPNPGAQQQFMDDYSHRYCALAGGWFAGKTWAGARKLLDLHLHNALDVHDRPTGVKSAVIAATYQLANDFDIPELRRAMREMNLAFDFVSDPKRYCFVLPDLGTRAEPSEILIRTADSPDRITGWSVGAIWGDEAARWKEAIRSIRRMIPFIQADARLRDPRGAVPAIHGDVHARRGRHAGVSGFRA